MKLKLSKLFLPLMCLGSFSVQAFESTKVLPKGIRNINIKNVHLNLSHKYNADGNLLSLGSKLEKSITFKDVVNKETGTKQSLLKAFLKVNHFELEDTLGQFKADMKGAVSVTAPVFSYGLTEDITLALVPTFYDAKMKVKIAFQHHSNAENFVAALHHPYTNNTKSAQKVIDNLNDAVDKMNEKLLNNGYMAMDDWHKQGAGDTTVAAKFRFINQNLLKASTTAGLVFPTGREQNPDILHDIKFGDGHYKSFGSILFDQQWTSSLFLNEYAKYTYVQPTTKNLRLKTISEELEVPKGDVKYKQGDQYETGASIQFEPDFGLVTGAGVVYSKQFGARVSSGISEIDSKLREGTNETATHLEVKLGYSTLPAFKNKKFPAPLVTSLEYKQQLSGINSPEKSLFTMDFSLFF